jgi:hypothetical protein
MLGDILQNGVGGDVDGPPRARRADRRDASLPRIRGLLLALSATLASSAAFGQDMTGMPGMAAPPPAVPPPASAMSGMDMTGAGRGGMAWMMQGALGGYAMTREASGTSWQPDATPHDGLHLMRGPWMLMLHGDLNGVADWQQGPRGGQDQFISGMIMGMAKRSLGPDDTLQFRVMVSPEPLMGKAGYPLLLASGETADGATPLIDRQHPHNLFDELSASYSHRLTPGDSLFVYAGLPGEPAFGPPAFMHRLSIADSPEAPISHHWLDSTHVTNGVVTAGWVHGGWKLEVSRFHGREPDQHRYAIEPGPLDSTSARLSWNPLRSLALQVSWANQVSPEQLQPSQNERRWTGSAIYTRPLGQDGWWSTTAAWGHRQASGGPALDAEVLESAVKPPGPWTLFARWERTRTNELSPDLLDGPVETVSKVSAGAIHDWRISPHLKVGLGALYAFNFVPGALAASYGSSDPHGAMGFVRLKLG